MVEIGVSLLPLFKQYIIADKISSIIPANCDAEGAARGR